MLLWKCWSCCILHINMCDISWENLVRILVYSPSLMATSGGKSLQKNHFWKPGCCKNLRSFFCFWPIKNVYVTQSIGIIPNGSGHMDNPQLIYYIIFWNISPIYNMDHPQYIKHPQFFWNVHWCINPHEIRHLKDGSIQYQQSSPWRDMLARAAGCWCCRCRSRGWGYRKPWPAPASCRSSKAGITMS